MEIKLIEYEKENWIRFGEACNKAGKLVTATRLFHAVEKGVVSLSVFDELGMAYRSWLCFDEYPDN